MRICEWEQYGQRRRGRIMGSPLEREPFSLAGSLAPGQEQVGPMGNVGQGTTEDRHESGQTPGTKA